MDHTFESGPPAPHAEPEGSLASLLKHDRLDALQKFIDRLDAYDQSEGAFRLLLTEAFTHFDVKAGELADAIKASHTTILRWKSDTAPTVPNVLSRIEATKRLRSIVALRFVKLQQEVGLRSVPYQVEAAPITASYGK